MIGRQIAGEGGRVRFGKFSPHHECTADRRGLAGPTLGLWMVPFEWEVGEYIEHDEDGLVYPECDGYAGIRLRGHDSTQVEWTAERRRGWRTADWAMYVVEEEYGVPTKLKITHEMLRRFFCSMYQHQRQHVIWNTLLDWWPGAPAIKVSLDKMYCATHYPAAYRGYEAERWLYVDEMPEVPFTTFSPKEGERVTRQQARLLVKWLIENNQKYFIEQLLATAGEGAAVHTMSLPRPLWDVVWDIWEMTGVGLWPSIGSIAYNARNYPMPNVDGAKHTRCAGNTQRNTGTVGYEGQCWSSKIGLDYWYKHNNHWLYCDDLMRFEMDGIIERIAAHWRGVFLDSDVARGQCTADDVAKMCWEMGIVDMGWLGTYWRLWRLRDYRFTVRTLPIEEYQWDDDKGEEVLVKVGETVRQNIEQPFEILEEVPGTRYWPAVTAGIRRGWIAEGDVAEKDKVFWHGTGAAKELTTIGSVLTTPEKLSYVLRGQKAVKV